MTGSAHNAEDDIAFYAASLGITHRLTVTAASVQTTDVNGPLVPGRWLLHIADVPNNAKIWVRMRPFEKGGTVVAVADVPDFPMHVDGIVTIEVNVRKRTNDRVAAIALGGGTPSGNLYLTLVSRDV